jgi:hypothetical protein
LLLASQNDQADEFAVARTLARALLAEPDDVGPSALAKLVRGDLPGEDLVALAALACRRVGGEAWQAFREESPRLLGDQPLPGSTIVLISRLDDLTGANP